MSHLSSSTKESVGGATQSTSTRTQQRPSEPSAASAGDSVTAAHSTQRSMPTRSSLITLIASHSGGVQNQLEANKQNSKNLASKNNQEYVEVSTLDKLSSSIQHALRNLQDKRITIVIVGHGSEKGTVLGDGTTLSPSKFFDFLINQQPSGFDIKMVIATCHSHVWEKESTNFRRNLRSLPECASLNIVTCTSDETEIMDWELCNRQLGGALEKIEKKPEVVSYGGKNGHRLLDGLNGKK